LTTRLIVFSACAEVIAKSSWSDHSNWSDEQPLRDLREALQMGTDFDTWLHDAVLDLALAAPRSRDGCSCCPNLSLLVFAKGVEAGRGELVKQWRWVVEVFMVGYSGYQWHSMDFFSKIEKHTTHCHTG
jgi:hypothetical protein